MVTRDLSRWEEMYREKVLYSELKSIIKNLDKHEKADIYMTGVWEFKARDDRRAHYRKSMFKSDGMVKQDRVNGWHESQDNWGDDVQCRPTRGSGLYLVIVSTSLSKGCGI